MFIRITKLAIISHVSTKPGAILADGVRPGLCLREAGESHSIVYLFSYGGKTIKDFSDRQSGVG